LLKAILHPEPKTW